MYNNKDKKDTIDLLDLIKAANLDLKKSREEEARLAAEEARLAAERAAKEEEAARLAAAEAEKTAEAAKLAAEKRKKESLLMSGFRASGLKFINLLKKKPVEPSFIRKPLELKNKTKVKRDIIVAFRKKVYPVSKILKIKRENAIKDKFIRGLKLTFYTTNLVRKIISNITFAFYKLFYIMLVWYMILFFYQGFYNNQKIDAVLLKERTEIEQLLDSIRVEKTESELESYYKTLSVLESKNYDKPFDREKFVQVLALKETLESQSYTPFEKEKIKNFVITQNAYKDIIKEEIFKISTDSSYIFLIYFIKGLYINYWHKKLQNNRATFFYEFNDIIPIDIFYKLDRDFILYNIKDLYASKKEAGESLTVQDFKKAFYKHKKTSYKTYRKNSRIKYQAILESYENMFPKKSYSTKQ